jgi:hypothetical protein
VTGRTHRANIARKYAPSHHHPILVEIRRPALRAPLQQAASGRNFGAGDRCRPIKRTRADYGVTDSLSRRVDISLKLRSEERLSSEFRFPVMDENSPRFEVHRGQE